MSASQFCFTTESLSAEGMLLYPLRGDFRLSQQVRNCTNVTSYVNRLGFPRHFPSSNVPLWIHPHWYRVIRFERMNIKNKQVTVAGNTEKS